MPLAHKCFNQWDVQCLLLLLESCAPASSVTNFKLVWKNSHTFITCYRKTFFLIEFLFHIDNEHLFLKCHTIIFVPAFGGRLDQPGYLPPQIFIECHSNVNLCPVFYLKAHLYYLY